MLKIASRYVGRNVVFMVILCTLGLVALSELIKFVDQLRNIGKGGYTMEDAFTFVAYCFPGQVVTFFPIGVLLGTVLALGNMASTSELIVMQALGKSRLSIVFSACFAMIPVIAAVFLIGEFVMPKTEKRAEDLVSEAKADGQYAVTSRGVWFKEENSFINIEIVTTDGKLLNVTRYTFDDTSIPRKLIKEEHSSLGEWNKDTSSWLMQNINVTRFTDEAILREFKSNDQWKLILTPEKLNVVGVSIKDLSISGLLEYIDYITANGQKAEQYLLELYRKIISPITILVVILLAASTIFGPLRSSSMGARVVFGIIIGFSFYAINQIFAPFTIFWGIPPLLGAAFPTVLVFIIAVMLLSKKN